MTAEWVVLKACTISAKCDGWLAFLSSPSFLIIHIIIWCNVSTNPLVCGW